MVTKSTGEARAVSKVFFLTNPSFESGLTSPWLAWLFVCSPLGGAHGRVVLFTKWCTGCKTSRRERGGLSGVSGNWSSDFQVPPRILRTVLHVQLPWDRCPPHCLHSPLPGFFACNALPQPPALGSAGPVQRPRPKARPGPAGRCRGRLWRGARVARMVGVRRWGGVLRLGDRRQRRRPPAKKDILRKHTN